MTPVEIIALADDPDPRIRAIVAAYIDVSFKAAELEFAIVEASALLEAITQEANQ